MRELRITWIVRSRRATLVFTSSGGSSPGIAAEAFRILRISANACGLREPGLAAEEESLDASLTQDELSDGALRTCQLVAPAGGRV